MSEKVINKGIHFVPANAVSKDAEAKIKLLMEKKKASLDKLVLDYKSGKLTPQK